MHIGTHVGKQGVGCCCHGRPLFLPDLKCNRGQSQSSTIHCQGRFVWALLHMDADPSCIQHERKNGMIPLSHHGVWRNVVGFPGCPEESRFDLDQGGKKE